MIIWNPFRIPINRNKCTPYQLYTHLNLYDDTTTFPCTKNWFNIHEENQTSSCGFQVYKGEFFLIISKDNQCQSIFTNSIFAKYFDSLCHKNETVLQLLHVWNILVSESIILSFVYIYVFASWFSYSDGLHLQNLNVAIGILKYQFNL